MPRLAAWILVWPAAVAADPKPTRLTMHYTEGTNLHIANQGGAMHWQADISITVDLASPNKLSATAVGSRTDHNLYGGPSSRSTDDTTGWTTRWTGTWTQSGTKLQLDLTLVDHTCKHESATTEFDTTRNVWLKYAPTQLACKIAAKRTQLDCTSEQIKVSDSPGAAVTTTVPAWRCTAKASTDLAETPGHWVLGKTSCIDMIGGKMSSLGYAKCKP